MGSSLLAPQIVAYIDRLWTRESPGMKKLREETGEMPNAQMQISAEEGAFLTFLIKALRPMKAIEVGVFTGYSSLITALAMPADGKLIACDVSEEFTNTARRHWAEAGVADKIELRLAPAAETLQKMIDGGESGTYDFVFIDADKGGYATYYEQALKLLRPGGVIAVDNVLWSGRVADPADNDAQTEFIRRFNETLHNDERIDLALAPVGDGLTLALKR